MRTSGLALEGRVEVWGSRLHYYEIHEFRTRSIYLCMGLHAGWFFVAKAAVYIADVAEGGQLPPGVDERYFLVGRPWTWVSIAAVGLGVWLLRRRLSVSTASSDAA